MELSCETVVRASLGEPHHKTAGEAYYRCPNHDDRHPSLKINFSKDKWLCGPCNASGGAWALAAFLARVGANEKKAVVSWLKDRGLIYEQHQRVQKSKGDFYQAKAFYYTPVLRNVRFETRPTDGSKPEKKFQWQHLERSVWKAGAGGMTKPLYANEAFKKGVNLQTVVGFEGEAKCDLAGEFDIPAFSYKYLTRPECQKLAKLEVIFWPDADKPGFDQAKTAATMLYELKVARKIRMCSIPIEFSVGWDIVDAVNVLKWDDTQVKEFIQKATQYPPPLKPIGRRLSDVVCKKVEWLWKDRVPCNGITMLDGDPGNGKGLLVADLAARITTGETLPYDDFRMPPANVIICNSEDSLEHTIAPRLAAAGADMKRVVMIPYAAESDSEVCFTRMPRDVRKVLAPTVEQEKPKLIVIDVLMSYIPTDLDSGKDQHVRNALSPLAELCDRANLACICTRHLRKGEAQSAIYRGGGSIAIAAASRSVLLLAKNGQDQDVRSLALVKGNLVSGKIFTANFRIESKDGLPILKWLEETDQSADDLLAGVVLATDKERKAKEGKIEEAMDFLVEMLSKGGRSYDEIVHEARDRMILRNSSDRDAAFWKARAILRIRTHKEGSRTWWELPKVH